MGSVLRHRSIVTWNQNSGLFISILLGPELETAAKVEEVLVASSVLTGKYA